MLEILSDYGGIIQWVLTIFCGWVWWSLQRRFTTKEDHNLLKDDHSALEKRVTSVETAIKNLPTISNHNELLVKVIEIGGNVKNTEEKVMRTQRQTDRIEDFLFKGVFNQ
ncbi:MAG: DUF2730 family protein [Alphaproteobacteria bacterium]|nr:DUF2730 family protein [Alphaproteobacteria bacterium]